MTNGRAWFAAAGIVAAGLVLGAAVALVANRDPGPPAGDAEVIAALASEVGNGVDAPCTFGHLVAAGALDGDLRRRIVDPDVAVASDPAVVAAAGRCGGRIPAPPPPEVPTTFPPVDTDTCAGDPDDPMVGVCAEELLAGYLTDTAGADQAVAHCTAEALVDRLGTAEVQSLLAGDPPTAATTAAIRAALAAC